MYNDIYIFIYIYTFLYTHTHACSVLPHRPCRCQNQKHWSFLSGVPRKRQDWGTPEGCQSLGSATTCTAPWPTWRGWHPTPALVGQAFCTISDPRTTSSKTWSLVADWIIWHWLSHYDESTYPVILRHDCAKSCYDASKCSKINH